MMNRRQTRQVMIGNVLVGGDAPIAVQSMCSTDTRDVDTTMKQVEALERMGCEILRIAVPTKESFLYEIGPRGALYVGSPETVAQKIAANLTALGANRFDLKYGMGGLSHEAPMTNIELYGAHVIPRVRELLA